MANQTFDVVVIGGGPGGYVAAIRASQLGFRTAVVDRDRLGGVCLNWGCIPTKALLKNAELYDNIKRGKEWGIEADNLRFDFVKIIQRSRRVADKMATGVDFLMKKNKVSVFVGDGTIPAPGRVLVSGEKKTELQAKFTIVATGARPRTIPGVEIDGEIVISSKQAMFLPEIPKSLVVIGAGAIGCEFAYFYAVLGVKVTIIEMQDTVLPVEDREISAVVAKSFKSRGIDLKTGASVEKIVKGKKDVEVTFKKNGKSETIKADKALMAIGVRGNVEKVGLEELGIELYRDHIKVNKEDYSTNVEGIYAIGDVIGPPWLAHVASAEGVHCVEKLAGLSPRPINYESIPGCTYCQPSVGSIGLTEEECKKRGIGYKVGKFPFRASGKAVAGNEPEGMVKLLTGEKYGEILGAHIVGSEATEMIAELCLAKNLEATAEDIHGTIHAHPTYSEAMMEAAADAAGIAIHI